MSEESAHTEKKQMAEGQDHTVATGSGPGSVSKGTLELEPGRIIAERYRVIEELGRGGMGVVYRVLHITLNRELALKTLDAQDIQEATWLRFQQEAKATSMLNHPNLISVHDYGIIDDEHPFFVMDLLEGTTLSKQIAEKGPLSIEKAIPIIIQVCFGLAYAHDLGIVHRDLKPSNIMLVKQPGDAATTVKIVDFGIAKLRGEGSEAQGLTKTGEIFGSPLYMSPEQCLGTKVDHRSDIYALGCVFFEALTGMPPFMGSTALATMMKHQSEKCQSLKEATLGKEFAPEIEVIIAKLMEKDPAQRYQSLSKLANDLSLLQQGISTQRLSIAAPTEQQDKRLSKEQLILTGLVCLLCSTLTGSVVYFAKDQSDTQQYAKDLAREREAFEARQEKNVGHLETQRKVSVQSSIVTKENGEKVRRINFIEFVGEYNVVGKDMAPEKALGVIEIPIKDHIHLRLSSPIATENPDFLLQFQSDDITELTVSGELLVGSEFLNHIENLQDLSYLDLTNDNVTDSIFPHLNRLPKLNILSIGFNPITEGGLLSFRRLKDLNALAVGSMPSISRILRELKSSDKMMTLNVRQDHLTPADIDIIATMPNLRDLCVNGNPEFNDDCVKKLLPLKNLERINISRTGVTNLCLPYMNQLPKLRRVIVNNAYCTEEYLNAVKKTCPNLTLEPWDEERAN